MSNPQQATTIFAKAIADYKKRLELVERNQTQSLLPTLLARDRVAIAYPSDEPPPPELAQQCIDLDQRLRRQTHLSELSTWRRTLAPDETAWWWYLDRAAEEREQNRDAFWRVMSGFLFLLTSYFAVEIIKRLWSEAPDQWSIFGTLLALLFTGGPLSQKGQALAVQAMGQMRKLIRVPPKYQAEAGFGVAVLCSVFVFLGWFNLSTFSAIYANYGFVALKKGDVATAQQHFQRAIALDPTGEVVSYYNLGYVYEAIGQSSEAMAWYQQAIEHDANFSSAYDALSGLYNDQDDFEAAIETALAGLRIMNSNYGQESRLAPSQISIPDSNLQETPEMRLVSEYGLLSNLGRAYFETEDYGSAEELLVQAVRLEDELLILAGLTPEPNDDFRRATPHFYLAQIYERQGRREKSLAEYHMALRLLKQDNRDHLEWRMFVREKISNF